MRALYSHKSAEKRASFAKTLLDAFPEIGLDETKLPTGKFIRDITFRRSLLESFAKRSGFDPLVAQNWYSLSFNAFNSAMVCNR